MKLDEMKDLPRCQQHPCNKIATTKTECNEIGVDCTYLYCDKHNEHGVDLSYAKEVRKYT